MLKFYGPSSTPFGCKIMETNLHFIDVLFAVKSASHARLASCLIDAWLAGGENYLNRGIKFLTNCATKTKTLKSLVKIPPGGTINNSAT